MKKTGFVSDFLKPILVLFCIAAVVAVVLAVVNSVTAPVIEENDRIAAEQQRKEALSVASSFKEIDIESLDIEGLKGGYEGFDASGTSVGYVFIASFNGYGGQVVSTVGIGNDGSVLAVQTDVSTETSGVGSKCGTSDFTKRFQGISESDMALQVDGISGATRTSTAVQKGVKAALQAKDAILAQKGQVAGGEAK